MHVQWNSVALDSFGVLRARGADARAFLQGQLSNDMARLAPDRALLAGYHNPQGRAVALLRLVQLAPDDVLGLLPRELVAAVASRLAKFVLRSKVKLADDSAQWRIEGLYAHPAPAGAAAAHAGLLPERPDGVRQVADTSVVRIGQSRVRLLRLCPAAAGPASPALERGTLQQWQLGAIAAGEPQVYAATSEEFVAQMLNLDVLDAIAFDKGCYTGQEVIARAHYRGRVKRRMQRFLSAAPVALRPGDAGVLPDGRAFKVVEAAQHADGRCEFLAVTALAAREADGADPLAAAAGVLAAAALTLPYALPD